MEDLEIDFAQDPLFQKTAADFDQGGANGLLLANLDISSDGRIIFDATDYVQTDADHTNGTDWNCDVGSLQGI
jgi:condensin complex subunit 2